MEYFHSWGIWEAQESWFYSILDYTAGPVEKSPHFPIVWEGQCQRAQRSTELIKIFALPMFTEMWFQKWGCGRGRSGTLLHKIHCCYLESFLSNKDEEINSTIFSYSLAGSAVLSCMNFFLSSTASSVPVAGKRCHSDLLLYQKTTNTPCRIYPFRIFALKISFCKSTLKTK